MIGQELGGRYEVIERIGGGGMAIVYKAHDILLHRKVAIKVLRQQFVNDEDFIRRFRREAQSAASLSHPNVVSIYDVGQEEDIHYIVMEYIEGSNLNDHIKERAPFQVEEAIHIATQICDALDHAHQNQIIHRDIKPHNILIGKNGRVKVTDFGIARAATSSEITQTGSVLGSVHYFSPEQAKGVAQGEKSDLYSLGIVLYQMLTNHLPFLGESPISVALKHLQENVEEPRKVNPLIPQSVENIILKALRKVPEERYSSAKKMLEDLETCLLPEKKGEGKIVYTAEDEDDYDKTLVMPAIRSNRGFEELYEDEERSKMKKSWIKPVIWAAIILFLIFLLWFGFKGLMNLVTVPEVEVPNVIGLPLDDAIKELETAGLRVSEPIGTVYDDTFEENFVVDQDKKEMMVKENSSIKLTVSMGKELKTMSEYIGQQWEDVEQSLLDMGLTEAQIEKREETNEELSGTVIHQSPLPNEQFNPHEDKVVITVSEGPGTVEMPNLIGKTLSEAEVALEKVNLKLAAGQPAMDSSFTVPKGYVFQQFPINPGEPVAPDTEIKIWVSTGYPEDALAPIVDIKVNPEVEGEPSTIKITIRDARGERERDPVEVTSEASFPIQVVVSKDTNATISILRNDKFYDSRTVSYVDAQEQNAAKPAPMEAFQMEQESSSSETNVQEGAN